MTTILDKIAGRFGYVRQPLPAPMAQVDLPEIQEVPPHLEAQETFRDDLVRDKEDWASFYEANGCFHFAIGRLDWMPVLMAGFIVGQNTHDGMGLLSAAIEDRLWLSPSSASHASWLEANHDAIEQVQTIEIVTPLDDESADEFHPSMFAQLPASIVSMELRTMWRRCYPYQRETLLSTTHGHVLFSRLDIMRQASNAPRVALMQLIEWTADWLAARGFMVDRDRMLVSVPGYQPLFHCDSDPGAF